HLHRGVVAGGAGPEGVDVDQPVGMGVDAGAVRTVVGRVAQVLAADVDPERLVPVVPGGRRLAGGGLAAVAGEEHQQRPHDDDPDDQGRIGQVPTLPGGTADAGLLDAPDLLGGGGL